MEAIFIYLVKSSGLLALFFISYHVLLRKETFFRSNRWFLLSGLCTALILPLLVYTKVVWVEPLTTTVDWTAIPATTVIEQKTFMDYWPFLVACVYGIGILILATKFLYDFYSLKLLLKGKPLERQADYKLVDTTENLAPFSYFNTIVYNSKLYTATELENILEHEKVHSDQNHTLDVLISRVFCIVFWFNPFVWLYKKAVSQNLEFIADSEATKKITDKKAYQITLLKITTQENCVAITNHFYQSLITKRIVMLNKNQSKKRNSWKYAMVLPALIAFFALFQVEVVAQEKTDSINKSENITYDTLKVELQVTPNSTEKELNEENDFFKETYNIDMHFSNIKFNKFNEITEIKVELKDDKGGVKEYHVSGNKAIAPFTVFAERKNDQTLNFGFYTATKKESKNSSSPTDPEVGLNIKTEKDFYTVSDFKKNGLEYLVIINGTKQVGEIRTKIPLESDFTSINILDPEAAIQKYGSEGKNGVVELITGLPTNKTTTTAKNSSNKQNTTIITGNKVWINNQLSDVPDEDKVMIFNQNQDPSKLGLDKIDPTNLNGNKISKTTRSIKIVQRETNGIPEDASYFIDGVRVSKTEVDKIDPSAIERMDVNKATATTPDIIKITTKDKTETKKNDGWAVSFAVNDSDDTVKNIQQNKSVDYKKAVVIINGKLSNYKAIDQLKADDIASSSTNMVANDSERAKQAAIAKYGKKALNGIITITTK